jgi:hypothetical protein
MARLVVTCPECGTRLETAVDDVGRDGQCPACESIFAIRAPTGDVFPSRSLGHVLEYQNISGLAIPSALVCGLLLMTAASLSHWVEPLGDAAELAGTVRSAVLGVSLACLLFIAVSAASRMTFAPAVLVGGTWGVAASCWLFGFARCLDAGVRTSSSFAPFTGIYVALAASLSLVGSAAYGYVQYRRVHSLRRPTTLFLSAACLGLLLGLGLLGRHTAPLCDAAVDRARTRQAQEEAAAAQKARSARERTLPQTQPPAPPPGGTQPEPVPAAPPTPEGTSAVAAPPAHEEPPPDRPADAPRAPHHYVWIEAEDALDHTCRVIVDPADINRAALSGRAWLAHSPGTAQETARAEARYSFTVETTATYTWWIRVCPTNPTYGVRLDEDDWDWAGWETGESVSATTKPSRYRLTWVRVDTQQLPPGTHVVTVAFPQNVRPFTAIDCMAFVNFDWEPRGTGKPR